MSIEAISLDSRLRNFLLFLVKFFGKFDHFQKISWTIFAVGMRLDPEPGWCIELDHYEFFGRALGCDIGEKEAVG